MNNLEKYALTKQASLLSGGIGAIAGALNAPEDLKAQGALRGTGIGLTSGLGAGLGGLAGFLGGGALGAGLFGRDGLNNMDESDAKKFAITVLLSQLLGAGAGGYGGYRAGKNLMWFDEADKKRTRRRTAHEIYYGEPEKDKPKKKK